jgi:glycosyltransferase involved in cell wall biosynthesis
MRLAVWSPLPPSSSGIADYVAEGLPLLARRFDVVAVVEDPTTVDRARLSGVPLRAPAAAADADLHVYHLGNSPAHAYVYRAARARPGVVVLHEWSLHHLVLRETVERGDKSAYLRDMRRAHGEAGTFVARQVARGLGGDFWPALYPLNERVLESALAVVGLTEYVASRARLRLPGRPVLHLPHHVAFPFPSLPGRAEARRDLGLPRDELLVTAPGLATAAKRLDVAVDVVARLRARWPELRLVVAGRADPLLPLEAWSRAAGLGDGLLVTGGLDLPSFVRHLAAADVVLALRFPSYGEISGALVRALGVGRPALVTGGTPAAEEFPEGVVVPVDPGPAEREQLLALLTRLLEDASLRETIGRLARAHVERHHDLAVTVERLAGFLEGVVAQKAALAATVAAESVPEEGLRGYLMDELRFAALDLGLAGVPLGLEPIVNDLAGGKK